MQRNIATLFFLLLSSFSIYAQSEESTFEFNSAGDLSSNFYNDGSQSYGSETLPRFESSGGLDNGGYIRVNDNSSSVDVDEVFITKQGYSNGGVGSNYTFSTYFKSNGVGYGGLGFQIPNSDGSLTTAAQGQYARSTGKVLGISFHGGGYIWHNGVNNESLYWDPVNGGSGLSRYYDKNGNTNFEDDEKWLYAELTIKNISTNNFEVTFKSYKSNEDGTIYSLNTSQTKTFINSDFQDADILHSYFAVGGKRISHIDRYKIHLTNGPSFIESGLPIITGTASKTGSTISLSGTISSDRGSSVTERGFVWSSSTSSPTILDNKITAGTGTGSFSSSITSDSEKFYVRAFATNSNGTSYGSLNQFIKITGDGFVYKGETSQLSHFVSGGTWSVDNDLIATITSTGLLSGVSAGQVVVTYTTSENSTSKTIDVVDTDNLGSLTVVSSGGTNEDSGWSYINGVIRPTSSSAVNINASDIISKLNLNHLVIEASSITINGDIVSTYVNNLTLKTTGNITVNQNRNIQSNGGDLIFWANAADGNTSGHILMDDGVTLNSINGSTELGLSGGGDIILAGGSSVDDDGHPNGYAQSSSKYGVSLNSTQSDDNLFSAYSGGGNIRIYGKSTTSGGDSWDRLGVLTRGDLLLNSGTGKIDIRGVSGNLYGVNLGLPTTNTASGPTLEILSAATTGTAISITGSSQTTSYGVVFNYNNPKEILATAGGDILITGSTTGGTYGIFLSNTDVLATDGTITIDGGSGIIVTNNSSGYISDFGYVSGHSSIGSSVANVVVIADRLELTDPLKVSTSGTHTFKPSGNNFSSAITYPISNLTLTDVTGLTIGKPSNAADVTIGSSTAITGPISIYGGDININNNLNTTGGGAAGDILLKASSDIVLAESKSLTTNGGNVILWSNTDNETTSGSVVTRKGSSITTNSGHLWIGGGTESASQWNGLTVGNGYAVAGTSLSDLDSPNTTDRSWRGAGIFIDGTTINTSGGHISMYGKSDGAYDGLVTYGINTINSGTGKISINAEANDNYATLFGVHNSVTSSITNITSTNSDADAIIFNLGSGTGTQNYGAWVEGDVIVSATNGGGITYNALSNVSNVGLNLGYSTASSGYLYLLADVGDINLNTGLGGITLQNEFTDIYLGKDADKGVSSSSSDITFTSDKISSNGILHFSTSGAITVESLGNSFTSAFETTTLDYSSDVSGLTIGKSTNTSDVTIGAVTIDGPLTAYGNNIAVNGVVNVGNNTVKLSGSGNVTDGTNGYIIAESLALLDGDVNLNNTSNNISTIAGGDNTTRLKSLSFTDASGGLTIGMVNPTGIFSTGPILIETLAGDINITENISTSSTSSDAIILNAGKSSSAGTSTGGDILVTGTPTLTTGTNGIVKLFSGSVAQSTGLTSISDNNYNGLDETSSLPSLTNGTINTFFREPAKSSVPQATDPWKPLIKLANFDPNDDQQAVKDTDLVGDATNAMLETQRATYNFSSGASNDEVYYFRVRMGASHSRGKLGTSFYLALDKDNDYVADVFVEANVKDNTPYVAFHLSDPSKAGTGPSNTGWQNSSNNENIERQLTSRDAFIKAYDADTDLDSDETDTWIEFAFTEESLKSFVSDALSSSIDGDSMFAIYTFTSTSQTANGDIGGIDDRTADLTKTWEELGIVIKGSLNEITTNAILAPSVKEETFSSLTPTITGTWGNDQGGTDTLAVAVNGVTYTTSGSDLTVDGYSWSLTIPDVNTLTAGTSYTVSATTTRSAESKTGTGTISIQDNDSSLSNISFNNITLSPTFNSTTYAYAMSVGATVGSTTFSATTNSNVASMTINGVPTASMSNTLYNIPYGTSTVTIIVYAPDGSNTTYTITITRSIIPTLSIVDGDATTDEDGDTAQISAVLPQAPSADVTLNFYVNDATEAAISPSSLTFTTSNWNIPQIITVTGIDDPISEGAVVRDGAQSFIITGTTVSSDSAYNGSTLPAQTITNQNTDPPGISVTTSGNSLSEDGGSITATFALLSNLSPTNATVTMTISLSDATEASFSASSIITSSVVTLTDSASSTSVTIYGVDDNINDGDVSFTLVTEAPTSDLDTGTESYDALTADDVADVNLQTTDNDKVGDVYTNFNGYWSSGAGNINSTKPNTDHDLLGFDFGGKTYATGVDNTSLDNHSLKANSNALNFDGIDDYVKITGSTFGDFNGTQSFSLQAYVKTTSTSYQRIISKWRKSDFDAQWTFNIDNGNIEFTRELDPWAVSSTSGALTLNKWHLITATYDGSKMRVYIDGQLEGELELGAISRGNDLNVIIGASYSNSSNFDTSDHFEGEMDEVSVWNRALTEQEIKASLNYPLTGNESGLLAYYDFNQETASGTNTGATTLIDRTGNGNTGTLQGYALSGEESNWVLGKQLYESETFQALPFSNLATSGSNYNRIEPSSASAPTGTASKTSIALSLTDGTQGLNMGSGLTNIPQLRQSLKVSVNSSSVTDTTPDIVVSQVDVPSASPDQLWFENSSGTLVGNKLNIDFSAVAKQGEWLSKNYSIPGNTATSETTSPLRVKAIMLSEFGLTQSDAANLASLVYLPSGVSDPAFIAYNTGSITPTTATMSATRVPDSYNYATTLSPTIQIQLQDASGTSVSQANTPIVVSVSSGTTTLSGTLEVNTDSNGVATFTDLKINGTSDVTLAFASPGLNTVTTTISFSRITTTMSGFPDFTVPTTQEPFALTPPTTNSTADIIYSSTNTAVATVDASTGSVTVVAAGTTSITASVLQNDYYTAGTITATITVTKADATIIDFTDITKTFGDDDFTLIGTSSSTGAISYTVSDTTVATVSGNTITIVGAGTTSITLTQASDANYNSATATITLTVNKATPSYTVTNVTKTYDDPAFNIDSSMLVSSSTGTLTFTVSDTTVATLTGTNTLNIQGSGSTVITAVQSATDNYTTGTTSFTLSVDKNNAVILNDSSSSLSDVTLVFSDPSFAKTATSSSTGAFTFTSSNTDVIALSTTATTTTSKTVSHTIAGAGTSIITVSQAADANYNAATVSYTVTVTKANPNLSTISDITKTYGDANDTVVNTLSTTTAIQYSTSNPSVVQIASTEVGSDTQTATLTFTGAGTAIVTATLSETTNYESATTSFTVTVNKATPSLSGFADITKTYGDADFSLVQPTSTSGGGFTYASSNTATATITGDTVSMSHSGNVIITATQAVNANYESATISLTLTINKASQSISVDPLPNTKPLKDFTTIPLTATSSSGNPVTVALTTGSVATLSGTSVFGNSTLSNGATCLTSGPLWFTPTTSGYITQIELNGFGSGETASLAVKSDYCGTALLLGTSNNITMIDGWNTWIFSSPIQVTANTTYYITSDDASACLGVRWAQSGDDPTTGNVDTMFSCNNNNNDVASKITVVNSLNQSGNYELTSIGTTGIITVTFSVAATSQYNAASVSLSMDVVKTAQSISYAPALPTEVTYSDGLTVPLTASASSGLGVSYNVISGPAILTGTSLTISQTGVVVVEASQVGNAAYNPAPADTKTIIVKPGTVTLSDFSLPMKVDSDPDFTITAPTSTVPGTVVYSSSNLSVANMNGNTVEIIAAGTTSITATQLAIPNKYNSASITTNFVVAVGDTDGDGVLDPVDLCPNTIAGASVDANGCAPYQKDTDADGVTDDIDNCVTTANADQADTDGDGVGDVCDNAPNTPNADQADTDGDGIPDAEDEDDDNDGVPDTEDDFPTDPNETIDTDGDGQGDNTDTDLDNDGVLNSVDNCPTTPNANQLDTDGDGSGDVCDSDDDGDGYSDADEIACGSDPLLASSKPLDTDGDGIPNCLDDDDDNDGYSDVDEITCGTDPLLAPSSPLDTDSDGIPDCIDTDDDGDGVLDTEDAFPLDKDEWTDTDGDGIGNNEDEDDDNDGQLDADEIACESDPLDNASLSPDFDQDGIPDCVDTDSDNDGVLDTSDAFPLDPTEWTDTDGDGIGNNTDEDDDNDGQSDYNELVCGSDPLKASSMASDIDGDTIPDCVDEDIDGDGCLNDVDTFPSDASECTDTDGDGLGDNLDIDSDNDGIPNTQDAFPLDASESKDTDGDGIGDNADTDDNNDGFDDAKLQVSGVLTPNSSGLEATWKIINLDMYPNARVAVYNKNGQEVFSAQGYKNDWRGTFKNNTDPLPAASYFYVIELNTGEKPITGWLYITY